MSHVDALMKEIGLKAISTEEAMMGVKLVKTSTLEMEYFLLPVQDTTLRFLYRFITPVPTAWGDGGITQDYMKLDLTPEEQTQEAYMAEFARKAFEAMVTENGKTPIASYPASFQWLGDMTKVITHECQMVRK